MDMAVYWRNKIGLISTIINSKISNNQTLTNTCSGYILWISSVAVAGIASDSVDTVCIWSVVTDSWIDGALIDVSVTPDTCPARTTHAAPHRVTWRTALPALTSLSAVEAVIGRYTRFKQQIMYCNIAEIETIKMSCHDNLVIFKLESFGTVSSKTAQRALGRSPEEKVKGNSGAIYRGPLMLSTKYW